MRPEIELIMQERERQINVEGWTPAHDLANHNGGELAIAAACYAVNKLPHPRPDINIPFPWSPQWDKRVKHDRLRSLVVAASLLAGEIARELALQEEAKAAAEKEKEDGTYVKPD